MSFKQFKSQFKKYGLRLALRYAYNRKRSWWMLKHDMVEGHCHRELHKLTRKFMHDNEKLYEENKKLKSAIEDTVKHGHWVKEPTDTFGFDEADYHCSVCKCRPVEDVLTKYCPHCGVKMDREARK